MFYQALPVFAILALLGVIAGSKAGRRRSKRRSSDFGPNVINFRYQWKFDPVEKADRLAFKSKRLFNSSETKLLRLLRDEAAISPRKFYVLGQVHLAELIWTDPKKKKDGNYYVIGSKRLDFVLVDDNSNAVLAVEYHGGGHVGHKSEINDKVKSIILGKAGIPLLVVKENEPDSSIRHTIRRLLGYVVD